MDAWKNKTWQEKWGGALVVVISVTVATLAQRGFFDSWFASQPSLDEIVEELNNRAPYEADSMTRVEKVVRTASGVRFVSTLVGVDPNEDMRRYQAASKQYSLSLICREDVWKPLRDEGGVLVKEFHAPSGELLFANRISTEECADYHAKNPGDGPTMADALNASTDLDVPARATALANEFKSMTPADMDDITVLTDAQSDGATVTLFHAIDMETMSADEQQRLLDILAKQQTNSLCSIEEYRTLLSLGVAMRYDYAYLDGRPIGRFDVSDSDCPGAVDKRQ